MGEEIFELWNNFYKESEERRTLRERARQDWLNQEVYADLLVIRRLDNPIDDRWVSVSDPVSLGPNSRSNIPNLLAAGYPELHNLIISLGLCCHAEDDVCEDEELSSEHCCLYEDAYIYRLMVLDEYQRSLGEASPDRRWVMSGDGNVDDGTLPSLSETD